jgi:protein CrcB
MIAYVWIAVGGAIGSVARAWLGLAIARITVGAFPWGTILINILGSLVIGFFATLTSSTSRYAVDNDIRLFVMVGLCGGFTTFSSFSLQTLDLVRDGRPIEAVANVGLSLVLCLGAVTVGHLAAAALRG